MLNIISTRKYGADAIPSNLTTLSVSWLNGEFRAVAVHRGRAEGTWEYAGEVEGANNFETLVREAAQRTGYHGQTVSLLLAHPRLMQQVVDAPPVKGGAMRKILQRQAQQQKTFPGEAAWTSQASLSAKGEQRLLLHIFPRVVLNQLVQGCQQAGLYLTAVVPPSAVLHQQLQHAGLEKTDIVLIAAETGGSTTVIVGRGDGQILLARTLPGTWKQDPERLALDLNRTVLFVNQQFGVTVNTGIRLFGAGAADHARLLQPHIQLPVAPVEHSPAESDRSYWAVEALKVPEALRPNFISPVMQQAPQRKVFARIVVAATCLVLLGSLGLAGYALNQARREAANIEALSGQLKRLQARCLELQQRDLKLTREQQTVKTVLEDQVPPVPLWFLGYLSEAVPPDLVVTNLQLKRDGLLWKVQLGGTLQAAITQSSPGALTNALAELNTRLTNGPFHMRIITEQEKQLAAASLAKPGKAPEGAFEWIKHFQPDAPGQRPADDGKFSIEGVMQ